MILGEKQIISIKASVGAALVSTFISSILSVAVLCLVYVAPSGPVQKVLLLFLMSLVLAFFLWFLRHAYSVELALIEGECEEMNDFQE